MFARRVRVRLRRAYPLRIVRVSFVGAEPRVDPLPVVGPRLARARAQRRPVASAPAARRFILYASRDHKVSRASEESARGETRGPGSVLLFFSPLLPNKSPSCCGCWKHVRIWRVPRSWDSRVKGYELLSRNFD